MDNLKILLHALFRWPSVQRTTKGWPTFDVDIEIRFDEMPPILLTAHHIVAPSETDARVVAMLLIRRHMETRVLSCKLSEQTNPTTNGKD